MMARNARTRKLLFRFSGAVRLSASICAFANMSFGSLTSAVLMPAAPNASRTKSAQLRELRLYCWFDF